MRVMATLALSVLLLLGGWFMVIGLRNAWRGHASASWPTAPGVVVQSGVQKSVSYEGTDRRRTSTSYEAVTVARYTVNGRDHETRQRRFGQIVGTSDPSDAAVLRLRYAEGTPVTVSYDPDDPSRGVLEPGLHAESMWLPGAGVAFFAAGVLSLVMFHASMRDSPSGIGLALTLFSLVFCAIGAALLTPGLIGVLRGRASRDWPQAAGVIVAGRIPVAPDVEDPDSVYARAESLGTRLRDGSFVYAYDVGGRRHYGNLRAFNQVTRGGEFTEELAARFPVGKAVTVRYAPDRPDLSVLEPGVAGEAWMLPGAGAAFLLFGLAAIRWGVPALSR